MVEPITVAALGATAQKAIEISTASLIDKISLKPLKDKFDAIKFDLNQGLPGYLAANYAKCQTLKTLLNRNDPIALEDCFVAPDFELREEITPSSDFLHQVNQSSGKVVITGLAGSGKSVFLKYSFRGVIEAGHSYYPIFFELRSLNGLPAKSGFLNAEIFKSIRVCCESFTRAQFNHGLKRGAFYFLLDGFDELKQEIREQVSSDIEALARKYPECAILVTSRPSDDFVSWDGFSEARLLPFDLKKAVDYISRLSFDEEKKQEFLSDVQDRLFEKQRDFLSNPLLCAMMLLTYDSFGEIPEKRHIFYSKCFDVLAREHDASKGRYKRELISKLSMDQIERVFTFFCTFSYIERQISFSIEQMRKYVDEAISMSGDDAQVDSVISDFTESISLMERVGLDYEFAHRSFQEYFYAKFVVRDRELSLEEKVDWLLERSPWDDTFEMIADMDRTYFEDEYLLPQLKSLDEKISKIDPNANASGVLSKFFSLVQDSGGSASSRREGTARKIYRIVNRKNHFLGRQAMRKYREEVFRKLGVNLDERRDRIREEATVLSEEFGGEVKIHHTNNAKLRKIGAAEVAAEMQLAISLFRKHLEEMQEKRKRGLGALIKRKYASGESSR